MNKNLPGMDVSFIGNISTKDTENGGDSIGSVQGEISSRAMSITSFTPLSYDIWNALEYKKTLKTNKANFQKFSHLVDKLEEKLQLQHANCTPREEWQINELSLFRDNFTEILKYGPQVKIPENPHTKRNILILGQMHYGVDASSKDVFDGGDLILVANSQKMIDLYQEYFLPDGIFIGHELADAIQDSASSVQTFEMFILLGNIFMRRGFLNKALQPINLHDQENIQKMFDVLEMTSFYGKEYFKKDDAMAFKIFVTLKYFLHKDKYGVKYISEISNYNDYTFSVLGQKKRINIEVFSGDDIVLRKLKLIEEWSEVPTSSLSGELKNEMRAKFLLQGMEYFIQNHFIEFWNQYLHGNNIAEKAEEDYNLAVNEEFLGQKITHAVLLKIFPAIENIIYDNSSSFDKLLNVTSKLDSVAKVVEEYTTPELEIIYFLLNEIRDYLTFEWRERNAIVNIERYFPKNQKLIPIIFGAGHNDNWEKYINEHNQKNPDNHYSLSVMDLTL